MNPTGREVSDGFADQYGLQETKSVVAYVEKVYKKLGLVRPDFKKISTRKAAAIRAEKLRADLIAMRAERGLAPLNGLVPLNKEQLLENQRVAPTAGRGLIPADRTNSLILGKINQADLRNAGRDDYFYARTVYQMLIDYSNTPDFDPAKKAFIDEKAREISSCIGTINSSLRDQVLDPSNSASHIQKGNIACGSFFKCMQTILDELPDDFIRYINNGKKADLRAKLEQYIENVQNVEPEAAPAAPHEEAASAHDVVEPVEELAPYVPEPDILTYRDAGPDLELLNKLKEAWVSLEGEDVPVEQTARRALMNALLAQKAETLTAPQVEILRTLVGSVITARTVDEVTLPDQEETLANIVELNDLITAQKLLLHRAEQAKELATSYSNLPIAEAQRAEIVKNIILSLFKLKSTGLSQTEVNNQRHALVALATLISTIPTDPSKKSVEEFFHLLKDKVVKVKNEDGTEVVYNLVSEPIETLFQNAYEIIKKAIGLALYNTIKAQHTELTQLSHALGVDLAAAHLPVEAATVINGHIESANRALAIVLQQLDHPETLEANQAVTMESLATARREIEVGRAALVQAVELDQANREAARTRVGLILTDLNELRRKIEKAKIFQEKRPVLLDQVDAEIRKLNLVQANIDKADTPFDLVEAQAILDEISERQIPAITANLGIAEDEAEQAQTQLMERYRVIHSRLGELTTLAEAFPVTHPSKALLQAAAEYLTQAHPLIYDTFFDNLNIAKVQAINVLLDRANVELNRAEAEVNREPENYRYRVADFVDLQGDKAQLKAAIDIVYGDNDRSRHDPVMHMAANHIVTTFVSDDPAKKITVDEKLAAKQLVKRHLDEEPFTTTNLSAEVVISESHAVAQLVDMVDDFAVEWKKRTAEGLTFDAITAELQNTVPTPVAPDNKLHDIKKGYNTITEILRAVEPEGTNITLLHHEPVKRFQIFQSKKNAKVLFLGEHSLLEAVAYSSTAKLRKRKVGKLPAEFNGVIEVTPDTRVHHVFEALINAHYTTANYSIEEQFDDLNILLKHLIKVRLETNNALATSGAGDDDFDMLMAHWISLANSAYEAGLDMDEFSKGLPDTLVNTLGTHEEQLRTEPSHARVLETIASGCAAALKHVQAPLPDAVAVPATAAAPGPDEVAAHPHPD